MLRTEESSIESLAARYAEIGGFPFDEARVAAIEDDLVDARVTALKRYLDQNNDVPINMYEKLSFESVGSFEEISKVEIPPVVQGKGGKLLLKAWAGSGARRLVIAVIGPDEAAFIGYRKFTSRDPYIVYQKKELELINLQGVDFEVYGVFETIPIIDGKKTIEPFLLDMIDTIMLRKYGNIRQVQTEIPITNERQQDS